VEKFSITAFYWGNKKNLEDFVEHAAQYTDDVVIVNIDLLNSFESFGIANIINVPYDYLFHNGHDDILNLANQNTKYDWVYYLAVGKRIVSIDTNLINQYPHVKYFFDREFGNDKDKWIKFHNKKHTHWFKKVHESVKVLENCPNNFCEEIILKWQRCSHGNSVNSQYTYDEREKKIYENFRQFTRLKWVCLENYDPHPNIHNANIWYNDLRKVYDMNKEELIEYLYCNDFSYLGM
jgi:hypothetical protein